MKVVNVSPMSGCRRRGSRRVVDLGCLGDGVDDGSATAKVGPQLMSVASMGAAGEEEWHRSFDGRLEMVL